VLGQLGARGGALVSQPRCATSLPACRRGRSTAGRGRLLAAWRPPYRARARNLEEAVGRAVAVAALERSPGRRPVVVPPPRGSGALPGRAHSSEGQHEQHPRLQRTIPGDGSLMCSSPPAPYSGLPDDDLFAEDLRPPRRPGAPTASSRLRGTRSVGRRPGCQ